MVLIAIKKSFSFKLKSSHMDPDGCFIILEGDINSKPYTLVTVYAPNTHQLTFLRKVFKTISSLKYGQLLMCGNFNLTVDPCIDSSSRTKGQSPSLRDLLHTEGVYNVWKCQHASKRDYTFFSSRHHTYSCIDLFMSDKWLLQNISSSIQDITWTDHTAISDNRGAGKSH